MHILFLSHYFPPEVNAPATRTYEHCRRWVTAGHQVTVVTCAPNCPHGQVYSGYRNAWRSEEQVEGIRVVRVWSYIAPNKGFALRVLNFLSYMLRATLFARSVPNVDVVVATSPQFFCGWAGVFTSWLLKRPLVLEIRDLWPDSIIAVDAMKRSVVIRALEWLERKLYRAAGHIVTVGNDYRKGLLNKGVPIDKIDVVPNGVDLKSFGHRVDASDLRRQLGAEGKFVCSYIGTVGMAHGLEVVLTAAETAQSNGRDDLMFWIIGDGARWAELEQDARRRRLQNVRFTGLLPKHQMPEAISASDACLVHLRGAELFSSVLPSKIFEFMALQTPIIMGVHGQALQIVLDAGAGVEMTPDDPASLLKCIDEIQSRGNSTFGGRAYVARNFNRDELAAEMLDVLCRFASKPEPRRLAA